MSGCKLLVTDIDNTLFDWVDYYAPSFAALLQRVTKITGIPVKVLAEESKAVFAAQQTIEYPFLVQELPSVEKFYQGDLNKLLQEAVAPARETFLNKADQALRLYEGVLETLTTIKKLYPNLPIVALTDAPRYVAMWKMNKLNLLPFFDAIYGLPDPSIPVSGNKIKVDQEILIKHLKPENFNFAGHIRTLPDCYEKPGLRGFKTVLIDYGLDEDHATRPQVVFIGDNIRKDIPIGIKLNLTTVWAKYGTAIPKDSLGHALYFCSPK